MAIDFMPAFRTGRGTLRFYSITQVREHRDCEGRAVVASERNQFAVSEDGAVRMARQGEVTEFLGSLLRGLPARVAKPDEMHIEEGLRGNPNDSQPFEQTPHTPALQDVCCPPSTEAVAR